MISRFFRWVAPKKLNDQAVLAEEQAREAHETLARVRAQENWTHKLAKSLKTDRENNHYGEGIRKALGA